MGMERLGLMMKRHLEQEKTIDTLELVAIICLLWPIANSTHCIVEVCVCPFFKVSDGLVSVESLDLDSVVVTTFKAIAYAAVEVIVCAGELVRPDETKMSHGNEFTHVC